MVAVWLLDAGRQLRVQARAPGSSAWPRAAIAWRWRTSTRGRSWRGTRWRRTTQNNMGTEVTESGAFTQGLGFRVPARAPGSSAWPRAASAWRWRTSRRCRSWRGTRSCRACWRWRTGTTTGIYGCRTSPTRSASWGACIPTAPALPVRASCPMNKITLKALCLPHAASRLQTPASPE